MTIPTLAEAIVAGKRVFIRSDLNVPMDDARRITDVGDDAWNLRSHGLGNHIRKALAKRRQPDQIDAVQKIRDILPLSKQREFPAQPARGDKLFDGRAEGRRVAADEHKTRGRTRTADDVGSIHEDRVSLHMLEGCHDGDYAVARPAAELAAGPCGFGRIGSEDVGTDPVRNDRHLTAIKSARSVEIGARVRVHDIRFCPPADHLHSPIQQGRAQAVVAHVHER